MLPGVVSLSLFGMFELEALISLALVVSIFIAIAFRGSGYSTLDQSFLGAVGFASIRPPRKPPDKTKYKTWRSQRSLVSRAIVSCIAFAAIVEQASGFTQDKDSGRSFTIAQQSASIAMSSSVSTLNVKLESKRVPQLGKRQISDESASCYFSSLLKHSKAAGAYSQSPSLNAEVPLEHHFDAAEFGPFDDEVRPLSSGSSNPAELCNCIQLTMRSIARSRADGMHPATFSRSLVRSQASDTSPYLTPGGRRETSEMNRATGIPSSEPLIC